MKTSCPIYGDIALAAVEPSRTLHAASTGDAAEFEQAIKHGAIVADVILGLLFLKAIHIIWRDLVQEIDVVVRMKLAHLFPSGRFRSLQESNALAAPSPRQAAEIPETQLNFHFLVLPV